MQIKEVEHVLAPMALLLLADPSEEAVNQYLKESRCFIAVLSDEIVGVCLLKPVSKKGLELMNIAVSPSTQKSGVGTQLLRHVIDTVKAEGAPYLEVGTGTFGYQLTFYQRQGFRVDRVDKDFFVKNYSKPLIENGIQHKDMLRLMLEF